MGAPSGLIEFSKTSICSETISPMKTKFYFMLLGLILFFILSLSNPLFWVGFIVLSIFAVSTLRTISHTSTIPLAVNINHPFMDTEYISESEIMVNFSGEWVDPGSHLLKIVKDPIHGWVVHKQDSELSILSNWETRKSQSTLQKQITIINQAISLNNAINESKDEFEDARDRESQESELLDRSWLEEEEIDVQGPISRIFSSE